MQLKELFKTLRIPKAYEAYISLNPNKELEDLISLILTNEIQSRLNNAIAKRIKNASFPTLKRFEELNIEYLPKDAQERLDELKSLQFIKSKKNLIMLGNSGSGKTHISTSIGIKACQEGYSVLFKTAARLINELKEAKNEKQLIKYARVFESYDLVILDELGYIPFDTEGSQLLFEYLSLRYESKSTIITSNLIFSEWIKIFQDKALTMALLDRLTHNAIILNMNCESYRRRKIEN
jgi:DNA replication protein DnaC